MSYKVLIPTAGTGSRLGGITKYLNKSLVSIGNKPTLARIIDMFPSDTEFVIPVGYKGELVKEFIQLAFPNRKIITVDVFPYEGEGSGLGLTILKCKDYLQCPFIFCSCDTLVNEKIVAPTCNWMAYDDRDNKEQYRTISVKEDMVLSINEKGYQDSKAHPYIGLCGVKDYDVFWKAMENGGKDAINQGESYGLRRLIEKGVSARKYTWFDTGVTVELEATRKRFSSKDDPNILEKSNEAIWFLSDSVIKFCDDTKFISDRVTRAESLSEFVPKITAYTNHMYKYSYAQGDVLSKCVNIPIFEKLLEFSQNFWIKSNLNDIEKEDFKNTCLNFYKKKTYDRVNLFYSNFNHVDDAEIINGVKYPSLQSMLDSLNWNYLADGLPGQFHGDFHFENILYDPKNDKFTLLDWRQNFGKSLNVGDVYYDLAKLNHGLIICHDLIAKDMYEADWNNKTINFDFARKSILVECEKYYYSWLKENGFDVLKVKMLTSIIFLNICALHHYPYSILLYGLGKKMLYECIGEKGND